MKSTEELLEALSELGFNDTPIFRNPDYIPAVVRFDEDGRVIYDFDRMVDYICETENTDFGGAVDTIYYDTINSLGSMGPRRPIILNRFNGYGNGYITPGDVMTAYCKAECDSCIGECPHGNGCTKYNNFKKLILEL